MIKKQLERNWIDSILDSCEDVGISKQIIQRFTEWYLLEEKRNFNE